MKWKSKLKFAAIFVFAAAIAFASSANAADNGVKFATVSGGSPTKDGSSWANAMGQTELVAYLTAHNPADTVDIHVASGDYSPGGNTGDTFNLKKGVSLYGGFPATGTPTMADRDWVANPTILSGDNINYHVVTGGNGAAANDTRLDGFIITGGNANGVDIKGGGGGMYNRSSSPTVENCTFVDNVTNLGGGMRNDISSPVITNCTFSGNEAVWGGGMYNSSSSPTITNCTFSGNTASNAPGGGMYNFTSSPTITNCTFSGNTASSQGGGMYNYNSSPVVVNTIFWGNNANDAESGHEIYHDNGTLTLSNDVIATDGVVSNSGTINSSDIFTGDPKIVSVDVGGAITTDIAKVYIYKISAGSSAIKTGLPVGAVVADSVTVPATDQRGNVRPGDGNVGKKVDIGSYESTFAAPVVLVTGVTVAPTTLALTVGGATGSLTATIAPDGATDKGVKWSSGTESVATVSNSGVVTAVAAGTATITATAVDGSGKSASCTVTAFKTPPIQPTPAPEKPTGTPVSVDSRQPTVQQNIPAGGEVAAIAAVAVAMPSIVAGNLDVVDGVVVVKESLALELAKQIDPTNKSVVALPVFSADVSANGNTAMVAFGVSGEKLMASAPQNVKVMKVLSGSKGEFFKYESAPGNFADKAFTIMNLSDDVFTSPIVANGSYKLVLFIKDGDSFDLDGAANSKIVDPAAIVGTSSAPAPKPNNPGTGSGCTAGFLASAIFLVAPLLMLRRKRK